MKITNLLILALGLSISSFGFGAVRVQCDNGGVIVASSIDISGFKTGTGSAVAYKMSLKGSRSQPVQPMSDIAGTSMCPLSSTNGEAFEVTCSNGRRVRLRWAFIKGFYSSREIVYALSLRDMDDDSYDAGEALGVTTCVIK